MSSSRDPDGQDPIIEELTRVRILVLHKKNRTARIEKDTLIDRYIELVTTLGRADFDDLLNLLELPTEKTAREREIRALRKAVRDIAKWVEQHNAETPERPIRVNFDHHGSLMVRFEFVQDKSVRELITSARARLKSIRLEIRVALSELDRLAQKIG